MTVEQALDQCVVGENNTVKLPPVQLDRKIYVGVKKALEGIGGKWKGGKTQGFVFQHDPALLLGRVQEGEDVNLKKDFQYFPTPADIADRLVQLALIMKNHDVLEPSAGQGAIVEAIQRKFPGKKVHCYELMEQNAEILTQNEDVIFHGHDFLKYEAPQTYDRIIANPPFTKNQDITHVKKMWDFLAPGGRIVTIMSQHWTMSDNKKERAFADWLGRLNADIHYLDQGSFKESGTLIAPLIIVIDKHV